MNGNASRFVRIGAGTACLLTLAWVLSGQAAKPVLEGLPTDWSHQRVIFSQPSSPLVSRLLANEPRFWQQEFRRSAARVVSGSASSSPDAAFVMRFPGLKPAAGAHRDWSQNMGSGASAGAGNYPAKFAFRSTSAACGNTATPDFVVFGTGLNSTPSQASIVAYDNLYSGCGGTVPSVYWAYRTVGQIFTSPVLSGDGTQIAFVQNTLSTVSELVLLKWKASTGTVSSPALPMVVGLAGYLACTAPCMTTIPLTDGLGFQTNDVTSSVFYDYQSDTAWVGDSGGWLHKFNPVFKAKPAEIRTAPWPVQVNPGNPIDLSSPVHDLVSDNIFVGDLGGFVERVNATTGAAVVSGQVEHAIGVVAGPVVDSAAQKVYVFASNDGGIACAGSPCSAVYVFNTNFGATTTGTKVTVGTSSPTPKPIYIGGFDSTYQASINGTGNLYVCGNTGGAPILYRVPIAAGVLGTPVAGPTLASAATGCSPVTDIPNPNAAGGSTEWIFASVQSNGSGNSCAGGGCLMNFKDQPWKSQTAYVVGQQVLDTHFQVQTCRVAGTSRVNTPNWSTVVGATTNDGTTVRWINQGPQTPAHAAWQASHAYALGTEILDNNNNVQLVITAGTSRTAAQGHPAWNVGVNGATNDATVRWRNLGAIATSGLASSGGTSGIIIDNIVGSGILAGASQVYYSTQGNQACGTSGTGGCAVQASQSALQ